MEGNEPQLVVEDEYVQAILERDAEAHESQMVSGTFAMMNAALMQHYAPSMQAALFGRPTASIVSQGWLGVGASPYRTHAAVVRLPRKAFTGLAGLFGMRETDKYAQQRNVTITEPLPLVGKAERHWAQRKRYVNEAKRRLRDARKVLRTGAYLDRDYDEDD